MTAIVVSSVPVLSFGIAQVATSGSAGAAGNTTCTGAGAVVTFAPPGLSDLGTASISAKSVTKTGSAAMSCVNPKGVTQAGTLSAGKIVSKSTTLCQNDTNPPNPCPTGEYVYDSVAQLASSASTLYKSDKSTSWVIKGVTYKTANTGSAAAGTGSGPGLCPSTEVGFVLTGHLTLPSSQLGKSTEITACLNTDTGPNTTGSFAADVGAEAGGNTSITIQTSTLDGATSSIVFA
jgi:hypothetical protein